MTSLPSQQLGLDFIFRNIGPRNKLHDFRSFTIYGQNERIVDYIEK